MLAQIASTRPKATPRCRKKSPVLALRGASPRLDPRVGSGRGLRRPTRLSPARHPRHPRTCPPDVFPGRGAAQSVEGLADGRAAPRGALLGRAGGGRWDPAPQLPGSGSLSKGPERPEGRPSGAPGIPRGSRRPGERRVAQTSGRTLLGGHGGPLRPVGSAPLRELVCPPRAQAAPRGRAALGCLGGAWAGSDRGSPTRSAPRRTRVQVPASLGPAVCAELRLRPAGRPAT